MALTKTELYLLKEVISKIKYDNLNERYTLYLEDYIPYNLKPSEIKTLKRLCQENDIFLEDLPKVLKYQETRKLFDKYNSIKTHLETTKDKQKLLIDLYEVRNQIVEGHMKLVYKLLNKYFPGIKTERDREDIYQIGYECLIDLIDKYDNSKNASFIYFICHYIIPGVVRRVYKSKTNMNNYRAAELKRFKITIDSFNQKEGRLPTKEELVKATNLTEDKIEQLLLIERFIEPESLDYEDDENIPTELIDYDFEDRAIERVLETNEHLNKIIELLPSSQCRIIKLYYGFEDGKTHTHEEIAEIVGDISQQRVQQIKRHSLYLIVNSVGGEYIRDIYGITDIEPKQKDGAKALTIHRSLIEDLFIESIPKQELLSVINELATNYQEIIKLYYGLENDYKCDYKEIGAILKIDHNKIRTMKTTSVNIIFKKYIQRHNPNAKNQGLNYMVNDYINNNRKIRH